ncbi:restriction endonuclease subunit S [Saccharomonospora xinjiangensis]|nr:restriction endonuclease subunit S [Saccharomonospora xinjiangensis]
MVSQAANQKSGLDWERTRFHSYLGDPRKLKGYLQLGDSLVNSTGTGTLGRVGWFEYSPDSRPCVADGHVTVVRFNPHRVHPRFGYYYLKSSSFQRFMFETLVTGSTNQIELSREGMRATSMPVPALEEQRRIADFLDVETNRIGKLIGMRTSQLELIESRSKCQLAKVLLPPIPPASWREIPIKYLFEFERAGVWGDDPAGDKSDVLCVRVADFDRISLTGGSTAATYRAIDAQQIRRRTLRKGDVLLEKSGGGEKNPVGFAVNYDGPENVLATTSNFVSILRPKSIVFPRFAGLLMAANYFAGMNIPFIKQTTGIQNLDGAGYLGRKVHLPTISEQVSIVRLLDRNLDSASRYRNSANHQIDLLAERRQALITAAVTGQLDVTTARSGVR